MAAPRRQLLWVLLLWLLSACGGACSCRGDALAELKERTGEVQRDFAATAAQWQNASLGARFVLGDGIRTGLQATAVLRVFPDTALRVESDTIVRFSATAPEAPQKVSVETGSVQVETAEVGLDVVTRDGVARVRGGTRARVRTQEGSVRFDVEVGRVEVESGGRVLAFEAGGAFELQVGKVVREAADLAVEGADDAVAPADAGMAQDDDAIANGKLDWLVPATAVGGVALPPGETVTVHVPQGAAQVALELPCAGRAKFDLQGPGGRLQHTPQGRVGLALPPGTFAYSIQCPDGSAESVKGRLRVRRDAATQRLPRTAPDATVRADGRRYTVRYQNRLPKLTFQWPDAPPAKQYVLTIRSGSRIQRVAGKGPRIALPSAAVRDGDHTFEFDAGAGRRSKQSSLRVVFDNTARAAALVSPPPSGFARGQTVTVAGVALSGSRVQVQTQPATVTADGRFRAEVPSPGEAVFVRVEHPQGGVHYYIRHAQ